MSWLRFIFCRLAVAVLGFGCMGALAQSPSPSLRGYLTVHDPSTVIQCKNRYYVYYTGLGILSKSSADKVFWSPGPPVFNNAPAWTTNAVPGFDGTFWAPDLFYANGRYYLYYSISTWQSQVSAIGLATNATLDPTDPAYGWVDQGMVIQSTNGSPYNTIDPCFTRDDGGGLWMGFGSYWNGIYDVELNPQTGLLLAPDAPAYHLAYNSSIEASYIYRRGGYYYLFADWGQCCAGVNSTYNMRVGRSTSVTGPYLDQNGVDMANNGGSLFQQGTGKFIGPGHVGILSQNGSQWLSYHYYDANAWAPQYGAYGAPSLNVVPLSWSADDWPVFSNNWCALYSFKGDARDDHGQYSGLFENGAGIVPDPVYGDVLNLNGTNQYVWLPPGAAYGETFVAVVKWRGGAEWQRIFDFGFDTTRTVMMTAASSDNVLRCDINPGGSLQTVQWTHPLPTNVWTQVAVTLDGTEGILYVNGQPVATNASMTYLPLNVAPQTNHLGRSKFTADPYFNGEYASFRVYSRALSAAEIAAPVPVITSPSGGGSYWPGTTINFSGHATDFAAVPLPSSSLSWEVQYIQDGQTNLVYGPVPGSSGSFAIPPSAIAGNYLITLSAIDSSNRVASVAATLLPANPPPPTSSYYPLQHDANDANGHYNGIIQGGAVFANDPVRGQVLAFNGAGQYVQLPAGLSRMQTFMAWVKWNGGAAWQRIYDTGTGTNHYSVLTPEAASGRLRFNISLDSIPGEQIVEGPGPLPAGVWTHVAVVMDGSSVVLYTNGAPVGTNSYDNIVPADLDATNFYLGKSEWPADPYFSGELSGVRVFSWPLTSNDIVAPQITIAQPLANSLYSPGETIAFIGSAVDFYDAPIANAGLTWIILQISSGATNVVFGPAAGSGGGSYQIPNDATGQYQIILNAQDSAGRSATNSVTLYSAASAAPADWASYYPFHSGAQDASNLNNGTLQGGASIVSDLSRGEVLNLSGSGQYVSLPALATTAQTVSGWVKSDGAATWQRIFDFGQNTNDWFFLTPADSAGLAQCAITTDDAVYNQIIESQTNFPAGVWTSFSVVMNGREGVLYVNNQAVGVNNSVNLLPSDIGAGAGYLGKSDFPADPYFAGEMSDFALNSQPLTLAEINAVRVALKASLSAGSLVLSWPQTSGGGGLYTAAGLSSVALWTAVTNEPVLSNGNYNVILPAGAGEQYFQLRSF